MDNLSNVLSQPTIDKPPLAVADITSQSPQVNNQISLPPSAPISTIPTPPATTPAPGGASNYPNFYQGMMKLVPLAAFQQAMQGQVPDIKSIQPWMYPEKMAEMAGLSPDVSLTNVYKALTPIMQGTTISTMRAIDPESVPSNADETIKYGHEVFSSLSPKEQAIVLKLSGEELGVYAPFAKNMIDQKIAKENISGRMSEVYWNVAGNIITTKINAEKQGDMTKADNAMRFFGIISENKYRSDQLSVQLADIKKDIILNGTNMLNKGIQETFKTKLNAINDQYAIMEKKRASLALQLSKATKQEEKDLIQQTLNYHNASMEILRKEFNSTLESYKNSSGDYNYTPTITTPSTTTLGEESTRELPISGKQIITKSEYDDKVNRINSTYSSPDKRERAMKTLNELFEVK